MTAANDNRLAYGVTEAAAALSVGTATVWRWVKDGKVKTLKIAAAPCLLDALKRARRYVADLPIVGDADLAVIDAAILKATTPNAEEEK